MPMTDQQIIQGLIDRDNAVTKQFLFGKCQPLFRSIIRFVFSYAVDYDEFVNELYQDIMKDDGYKLRQFDYRCTLLQWLKIVAIRYFIRKRDEMIEDVSKDHIYNEKNDQLDESENRIAASMDMERLFSLMDNKRYVNVIQKLVLEGVQPESLAKSMNITPANLYNIKKRAMASLTHVALKDIKVWQKVI
jgi:RNA polymerase sigma factor (sigma-70 family)